MAVNTIHMIGNRPNTAPWVAERKASWNGICQAATATMMATATAVRPAQCAFQRSQPSVTKMVIRGSRPTMADSHSEPNGEICGVKFMRFSEVRRTVG